MSELASKKNAFHNVKEELQQVCNDISTYLTSANVLEGVGDTSFREWEATCRAIQKQMEEEVVRVAVVGAIKSGKSTFVNSLFNADYLKRGAGVVTSIVTRIRRGPYLKAKLYFKSWDEINAEMSQALTLFPSHAWESEDAYFDIRRAGDRETLSNAIDSIQSNLLLINGIRNTNSILIDSYLKGYDLVKDTITPEGLAKVYEDDLFGEQKMFVGSDHLAVYLKDVLLEIRDGDMAPDIEIADCQGSDSPNPLHLSMIQEYLLQTHLIIYVISSRTGLRQADLRFLSIIKNMGILENILFVVNCDFSEHESLEGLKALAYRTKEELSIVRPESDIFVFSSLYNLFKSSFKTMTPKEEMRFSQWQTETPFIMFSDEETERFQKTFSEKLGKERYSLLLKNNIERLDIVAEAMVHWADVHQEVLGQDTDGVATLIQKMTHHRQQMTQIASLVKNTLEGASQKIKQDLKQTIDRFFDARGGPVVKDTLSFIRNFQIDMAPYQSVLESSRFTEVLYLIFQDFRSAVDNQLAETIHPRIVKFIQKEEETLKTHLESVAAPYSEMIKEAMHEYRESMSDGKTDAPERPQSRPVLMDLKTLKSRNGLRLPPVSATMRYSARIKSEAVMRLGLYSALKIFRKLLKKSAAQENSRKRRALKDGFKRIKIETERSMIAQFRDYQENVKFQHLFRLIDAMVDQLNEDFQAQFQSYSADTSKMIDMVKETHVDKERLLDDLRKTGDTARNYLTRIKQLRRTIDDTPLPINK